MYKSGIKARFFLFILVSFAIHVLFMSISFDKRPEEKSPHRIEIVLGGRAFAIESNSPKKDGKKEKKEKRENKKTKKRARPKRTKLKVSKRVTKKTYVKKVLLKRHPPNKRAIEKPVTLNKRPEDKSKKKENKPEKRPKQKTKTPEENTKRSLAPSKRRPGTLKKMDRAGATISQKGLRDYLSKVRAIIEQHKFYPYNARIFGREGEVMVSFLIGSDGTISDVSIIRPSRYKDLNRATIKTLKRSNPLPPPPKTLSPPLKVETTLRFEIR